MLLHYVSGLSLADFGGHGNGSSSLDGLSSLLCLFCQLRFFFFGCSLPAMSLSFFHWLRLSVSVCV